MAQITLVLAVCLAFANFLPSEGNPLTQPDQDRIKGLSGQLPEAPSASATPSGPQTSQDRNAEPSGSLPATPRRDFRERSGCKEVLSMCDFDNDCCSGRCEWRMPYHSGGMRLMCVSKA